MSVDTEPHGQTKNTLMNWPTTRLLSLKQVSDMLSLSQRTIYNYVDTKGFPKPLRLTARRIAFEESDVLAWIDGLRTARDTYLVVAKAKKKRELLQKFGGKMLDGP